MGTISGKHASFIISTLSRVIRLQQRRLTANPRNGHFSITDSPQELLFPRGIRCWCRSFHLDLARGSRCTQLTRARDRIPKRIHHGDFDARINPEGRPEHALWGLSGAPLAPSLETPFLRVMRSPFRDVKRRLPLCLIPSSLLHLISLRSRAQLPNINLSFAGHARDNVMNKACNLFCARARMLVSCDPKNSNVTRILWIAQIHKFDKLNHCSCRPWGTREHWARLHFGCPSKHWRVSASNWSYQPCTKIRTKKRAGITQRSSALPARIFEREAGKRRGRTLGN